MKKSNAMKWGSLSVWILFLLVAFSPNASAKEGDIVIEGSVGVGIGPEDPDFDFGATLSGGIGVGYEIVDNLQLRVDVSYFEWEDDISAPGVGKMTLTLRNIPIFLGGRYFVPISENVNFFTELGLSVNFYEATGTFNSFGVSVSESETKIGIVPGLGIEVMVTPHLGLGAGIRYHAIDKGVGDFEDGETSFLSAAALINYHFRL